MNKQDEAKPPERGVECADIGYEVGWSRFFGAGFAALGVALGAALSALSVAGLTINLTLPDPAGIAATLQPWQTLLAGIFGFVGLITAHILNARESRRVAAEEHYRKASSLAAALHAEIANLITMCGMMKTHIETLLKKSGVYQDDKLSVQTTPENIGTLIISGTRIYESNCGNIGQLPENMVPPVVDFYNQIFDYNQMLTGNFVSASRVHNLTKAVTIGGKALVQLGAVLTPTGLSD